MRRLMCGLSIIALLCLVPTRATFSCVASGFSRKDVSSVRICTTAPAFHLKAEATQNVFYPLGPE